MFSIIQTIILKNKAVKRYFDIPDPPKVEDTPVLKLRNPFSTLAKSLQQQPNEKIEVIDPSQPPPPPSFTNAKSGDIPVTYAAPPKKK